MEIRNKLWEEIKSADINVRAILWYNNRHRTYNRLYDTFIAVVASAGALLYPIESKLPLISSIVIAMTSLVKAIFPQFIQSEKELTDLDRISDYYESYKNDLESLFYKFDKREIDEKSLADKLFEEIKNSEGRKTAMNRLIRRLSDSRMHKLQLEEDEYLKEIYYDIYPERRNESQ